MANDYWIQVNDYHNPVFVELTDAELKGVRKLFKSLAAQAKKENDSQMLLGINDADNNELFSNWDNWVALQKDGE